MPLKKELSLLELTLCGVGIIVGAGIYALIGEGAALAGNALWLSFALAAVIAGTTGLSYAELSSMYPKAGAEYDFAKHAFGNKAAFIVGWLVIFASIVSATVVAIGFGRYFGAYFGINWIYGALLIIALSTIIMLFGIELSAKVASAITILEVLGLIFIIFVGIPHMGNVNIFEMKSVGGVLSAAALVFFAFIGFEEIVRLSEETKNAKKVVPKALVLSIAITTLLYMLVAIASVSIVGWQALAEAPNPLAVVANKGFGASAYSALSLIALFSTANTVLLVMLSASRIIYGMSKEHALPNILHKTSKTGVPYVSVIVTGLLSSVMLAFGSISFVANAVDFAIFLVFIIINVSLIKLRYTEAAQERVFKVPFSIGKFPVLPLLGILFTLILIANIDLNVIIFGGIVTVIGLIIALLFE
ncbi:MAG: amino acid transporter [Candidatus Iainarchaeum archaeon]|uniref:Amino acid transporter n=1 Tax=Candidatus Iainarchaeum sp. TaxID=3101447 RepID=A0A497JFC3_9ARCH|nr:MAG: amino acid transporter [Candidatus Diapherotrites archaeon]